LFSGYNTNANGAIKKTQEPEQIKSTMMWDCMVMVKDGSIPSLMAAIETPRAAKFTHREFENLLI
jgi:hypothetical protein